MIVIIFFISPFELAVAFSLNCFLKSLYFPFLPILTHKMLDTPATSKFEIVRQVLKMMILGIPLAVGPLLQLATAQAGTCNSQKKHNRT